MSIVLRSVIVTAFAFLLAMIASGGRASAEGSLHDAAGSGDIGRVDALIEEGASIDATDRRGLTPLLRASFAGQVRAAARLVEAGADVSEVHEVDAEVVRELGGDVAPGTRVGVTPLFVAAWRGDEALVDLLIAAGADVDVRNEDGMTALMLSALENSTAAAEALIAAGADVNAIDRHGNTPLRMAVERPNTEMAEFLIAAGAVETGGVPWALPPLDAPVATEGRDPWLRAHLASVARSVVSLVDVDPFGIAVDVASGELYWTEFGTGRLRRAALDGSGVRTVLTEATGAPIGVAIDTNAKRLYWSADRSYPRRVRTAMRDGTAATNVVSGTIVNRPLAVAVDGARATVYWTESISGRIRRARADGSKIEDLLTSGISSVADRPDAEAWHPLGLALDLDTDKLYWSDLATSRIERANLDGSEREVLLTDADGLHAPAGLALDLEGASVYWSDLATGDLHRAGLDGRDPRRILGAEDGVIFPHALAVAGGRLWWTDPVTETIESASLDGLRPERVLSLDDSASHRAPIGCRSALADEIVLFVRRIEQTISVCLTKVDALKAVKRDASDGSRAVSTCRAALARIGDGSDDTTMTGRLREPLERNCSGEADDGAVARSPTRAALADAALRACDGGDQPRHPCLARWLVEAAWRRVALEQPKTLEWLAEVRPFLAAAAVDDTASAAHRALAALDAGVAVVAGDVEASRSSKATGTSVPRSGQTSSYAADRNNDDTSTPVAVADDGAVRAGAPLRYVDNRDGTVTDVATGLMWEKKCDGCEGLHYFEHRYAWEDAPGRETVGSWLAEINAEGEAGFGGYSDWRMPTVHELVAIVDYELFNPAVGPAFDGAACGLGCTDLTDPACSCTSMRDHWSSTPYPGRPDHGVGVAFHLGLVGDMSRRTPAQVRAVRAVRAARAIDRD